MVYIMLLQSNKWFSYLKIILPTFLSLILFVFVLFILFIPRYEQNIMNGKQEMLRELTNIVISRLNEYDSLIEKGILSSEQAKKQAVKEIELLRYGPEKKDYFWITDTIPVMVMHPYRKDLNNKNVASFTDPDGKKLFSEFTKAIKEGGSGYVDYKWQWKDDPYNIVSKRSYVVLYNSWGWIIGTGVYIEDVKNEISTLTRYITNVSIIITLLIILLLVFIISQNIKIDKQRVSAVQNLLAREKELKGLNKTKDKLFSIIAHDLRSPFSTILGFADILNTEPDSINSAKKEEIIQHIYYQTKETLSQLDNLLCWAKTQLEQIKFSPEELNLSLIITSIIESLKLTAQNKNITINYLQPSLIIAYADKNMLTSILRNLLTNSIKFTNYGGQVNVETKLFNNRIEVSISDNGVGMDANVIENLFSLDINNNSKGTANEKGSGLGLILCKEFVEKHNGKIWVDSTLGKGSKFSFTIPIQDVVN